MGRHLKKSIHTFSYLDSIETSKGKIQNKIHEKIKKNITTISSCKGINKQGHQQEM
jgi:hypothetical protein